jgi:hypothetical protein
MPSALNATAHAPAAPSMRRRIAMGVFARLDALELAVDALLKLGVGPSHLVLVTGHAGPDSLAGIMLRREGGQNTQEIRLQGRHGATLQIGRADQSAFAAPGLLSAPFETWGVAETTRKLSVQLDRGACVLVALVAAAEGEREVVEILLAHSIDQVQQHDIPSPTNV